MREHGRTISLDVFIEPQARSGTPQYRCQRGLPCIERLPPQVVAVQLDQVEGIQEDADSHLKGRADYVCFLRACGIEARLGFQILGVDLIRRRLIWAAPLPASTPIATACEDRSNPTPRNVQEQCCANLQSLMRDHLTAPHGPRQ